MEDFRKQFGKLFEKYLNIDLSYIKLAELFPATKGGVEVVTH